MSYETLNINEFFDLCLTQDVSKLDMLNNGANIKTVASLLGHSGATYREIHQSHGQLERSCN
jgi:hypothetical protein